jgi:hypothetical protein
VLCRVSHNIIKKADWVPWTSTIVDKFVVKCPFVCTSPSCRFFFPKCGFGRFVIVTVIRGELRTWRYLPVRQWATCLCRRCVSVGPFEQTGGDLIQVNRSTWVSRSLPVPHNIRD